MRVLGLISGGKDSLFNLLECQALGHEIVALGNLYPDVNESDDLESWMFQTVGHEGIPLIAKAMDLPLYRIPTKGKSICRELNYVENSEDEVEDLINLIKLVQSEHKIEGVASGAIESDYQRLRVEYACGKLNLISLAYLWKQDQINLLEKMIKTMNVICIKVSSFGLFEKDLGKSLVELKDTLLTCHRKFGLNVCGEGGEYETFVLDCPLFKFRINVNSSHIINVSVNKIAPVAYLKLDALELIPKISQNPCTSSFNNFSTKNRGEANLSSNCAQASSIMSKSFFVKMNSGCCFLSALSGNSLEEAFSDAKDILQKNDLSLDDVIYVTLWLKQMSDFNAINDVYKKMFARKDVPARACLATYLPENIQIEMVAGRDNQNKKKHIHVQSLSHWAPACIGPYSQLVQLKGMAFTSGQIALQPEDLQLITSNCLADQLKLALKHIETVLKTVDLALQNVCQLLIYIDPNFVDMENDQDTFRLILKEFDGCVAFIGVLELPKKAVVECQAIAEADNISATSYTMNLLDTAKIYLKLTISMHNCYFVADFVLNDNNKAAKITEEETKYLIHHLLEQVAKESNSSKPSFALRIFLPSQFEHLEYLLRHYTPSFPSVLSLIVVRRLRTPSTFVTIIGLCDRLHLDQ